MFFGLPGRDRDLQLVARERLRRLDEVRVDELLHVLLVGRREHVGGRALLDLRHECLRSREVVRELQVRVARGERGPSDLPNAFVSDAAPNTVRSPFSFEPAVVGGDDVDDDDDFELLPHAVATNANVTDHDRDPNSARHCDPSVVAMRLSRGSSRSDSRNRRTASADSRRHPTSTESKLWLAPALRNASKTDSSSSIVGGRARSHGFRRRDRGARASSRNSLRTSRTWSTGVVEPAGERRHGRGRSTRTIVRCGPRPLAASPVLST